MVFDFCNRPLARVNLNILCLVASIQPSDGLCYRMWRQSFNGGCIPCNIGWPYHLIHRHIGGGKYARLVYNDGVNPVGFFKGRDGRIQVIVVLRSAISLIVRVIDFNV